ncbi:MAG: zinc-dependent peptidase [Phycisphaerales bacterium]|nr:zinc-dependent peptidase [Phycisphaerales bacterium]
MFGFLRRRRRRRLRDTPLPEALRAIIDRNVRAAARLTAEERRQLEGHVQVLLHEKRFEGCAGLEITDEIRITIAAQAALLLLNRDPRYYPTLRTILVYPSAYVVRGERRMPDGTVAAGPQVRLGESWQRGSVVLSWSDARRGGMNHQDGRNVVLHEFAHQLDGEDGLMDGTPALDSRAAGATWAHVMQPEFDRLRQDIERDHPNLIRDYGATNPAEFFAVVTETFFERPDALRREHPALYEQLATYFRLDLAAR